MASGFVQRFKGKIKASQLWLDGGNSLIDAPSGIAGQTDFILKVALAVTATANTDIAPISLPAGRALLRATVYTTTAFTASTDCQIEIGSSAGSAAYVAAVSVKSVGVYGLTMVNSAAAALAALPSTPNIYVRLVQSGTATAVGAGTLVLEYA